MNKRTLTKCPFNLTRNTKIQNKATKGRMFNKDATKNKLLKSVTTMKCKDTGDELFLEQIVNYLLYLSHWNKK